MTSVQTAAKRGTSNRRRGHTAERDVAKWLRAVGYPDAERAVVTGAATLAPASATRTRQDPGDIAGVPFIVSVKDCATEQVDRWFDELDAMAHLNGLAHPPRLLVHKRRGKADPGRWWCWMRAGQFTRLAGGPPDTGWLWPVRLELAAAIVLLAESGEGPDAVR